MFDSVPQELESRWSRLIVEPYRIETGGVCTVKLVKENPNFHPVLLPANQVIGCLQTVKLFLQKKQLKRCVLKWILYTVDPHYWLSAAMQSEQFTVYK